MLELMECGAGDHVLNIAEVIVAAEAAALLGESEPGLAAELFDERGERAVIDERVADGGNASGLRERGGADEDAASGGSGGGVARVAYPGGRVEFEEKKDEGRDEQFLGEGVAVQLHHEGGEVVAAIAGQRGELSDGAFALFYVGVSEQEPFGIRFGGLLDALVKSPEFSGPARRKTAAGDDGEAIHFAKARRGAAGGVGGTVGAVVVDEVDGDWEVALREERAHDGPNHVGFVTGGDDGGDGAARHEWKILGQTIGTDLPEEATSKEEPCPDGDRQHAQNGED